jgi:hypothetical protein
VYMRIMHRGSRAPVAVSRRGFRSWRVPRADAEDPRASGVDGEPVGLAGAEDPRGEGAARDRARAIAGLARRDGRGAIRADRSSPTASEEAATRRSRREPGTDPEVDSPSKSVSCPELSSSSSSVNISWVLFSLV